MYVQVHTYKGWNPLLHSDDIRTEPVLYTVYPIPKPPDEKSGNGEKNMSLLQIQPFLLASQ